VQVVVGHGSSEAIVKKEATELTLDAYDSDSDAEPELEAVNDGETGNPYNPLLQIHMPYTCFLFVHLMMPRGITGLYS